MALYCFTLFILWAKLNKFRSPSNQWFIICMVLNIAPSNSGKFQHKIRLSFSHPTTRSSLLPCHLSGVSLLGDWQQNCAVSVGQLRREMNLSRESFLSWRKWKLWGEWTLREADSRVAWWNWSTTQLNGIFSYDVQWSDDLKKTKNVLIFP